MKLSDLPADLLAERPHLFSSATVPIVAGDLARMRDLIAAVESVIASPAWAEFVKVSPGGTAQAAHGAFMGYDFHRCPGW